MFVLTEDAANHQDGLDVPFGKKFKQCVQVSFIAIREEADLEKKKTLKWRSKQPG